MTRCHLTSLTSDPAQWVWFQLQLTKQNKTSRHGEDQLPAGREGLMLNTIMPHYFHTPPGNRNCLLVADNLTILVEEVRRKQNKEKKVKSLRSRIIVTPSDTEGSRMRCDCALSPVARHVGDGWLCLRILYNDWRRRLQTPASTFTLLKTS